MLGWPIFYGLISLAVIALAIRSSSEDTIVASVILFLLFCMSNLAHLVLRIHTPYNAFFVILDAGVAAILAIGWRASMTTWKSALILLLLADLVAHMIYSERRDTSYRARYDYDLALNILFLGQLACVAIPCGWRLWGRKISVWGA